MIQGIAAGIGIGMLIMGLYAWFLLSRLEKNLKDDIKKRSEMDI